MNKEADPADSRGRQHFASLDALQIIGSDLSISNHVVRVGLLPKRECFIKREIHALKRTSAYFLSSVVVLIESTGIALNAWSDEYISHAAEESDLRSY